MVLNAFVVKDITISAELVINALPKRNTSLILNSVFV